MFRFAFAKRATSSNHSLCCTGLLACVGAQLMLMVTLPSPDEFGALLLEQAAAPSPSAATAATAVMRPPCRRCTFLVLCQYFFLGLYVAALSLPPPRCSQTPATPGPPPTC